MLMGKIGGSFRECGSYYPVLTYADELWDLFYVEACQELDREFPEARLLPSHSWSLGLSSKMKRDMGRPSWDDRILDLPSAD